MPEVYTGQLLFKAKSSLTAFQRKLGHVTDAPLPQLRVTSWESRRRNSISGPSAALASSASSASSNPHDVLVSLDNATIIPSLSFSITTGSGKVYQCKALTWADKKQWIDALSLGKQVNGVKEAPDRLSSEAPARAQQQHHVSFSSAAAAHDDAQHRQAVQDGEGSRQEPPPPVGEEKHSLHLQQQEDDGKAEPAIVHDKPEQSLRPSQLPLVPDEQQPALPSLLLPPFPSSNNELLSPRALKSSAFMSNRALSTGGLLCLLLASMLSMPSIGSLRYMAALTIGIVGLYCIYYARTTSSSTLSWTQSVQSVQSALPRTVSFPSSSPSASASASSSASTTSMHRPVLKMRLRPASSVSSSPLPMSLSAMSALSPRSSSSKMSDVIAASVEDLIRANNSDAWKQTKEESGVIVDTNEQLGASPPALRGRGIVPYAPLTVLKVLWNTQLKGHYDDMFKAARVIERIDDFTNVEYHQYHGKLTVTGRDFCVLSHWCRVIDHRGGPVYLLAVRSTTHPDCPSEAESGLVRGSIRSGGFILQPVTLANASTGTCVTFIANTDLRGRIPLSIQKLVGPRQPLLIASLSRWLGTRTAGELDASDFEVLLLPVVTRSQSHCQSAVAWWLVQALAARKRCPSHRALSSS